MTDRFRRWFEYEKEAHAKTFLSLQTVPEAQRASTEFHKAVRLFAHLVAARKLWLYRFGVSTEPIDELFPQAVALENLEALAAQMHALWDDYLARLDDEELERVFEYQSLDSARFRNSIEEILTQLFGHSLYHRGQIAQLVKNLSGQPAVTDFVYWSRVPVNDVVS
ncbi:MAG: DinB family protein [Acidobacteria bacterium]|nr:DinB family protein [Acidobacteriota bacterium]